MSRLMSPYLEEAKTPASNPAPAHFMTPCPPPQEIQECNILIQDFVVLSVRELLQLQRVLGDKSHCQMKIVVPQL